LIILGCNSIPTINSKNVIPIVQKLSIHVFPHNILGKKIEINEPAKIYPIIIGCFNNLTINKDIITNHNIILKPYNKDSHIIGIIF